MPGRKTSRRAPRPHARPTGRVRIAAVLGLAPVLLVILPAAASATADTLWVDTHWTPEGGDYVIEDTLVIAPGAVLTIDPGVRVLLGGGANLLIHGGLQAQGTPEAPIEFTRLDSGSAWMAIAAMEPTDPFVLEHCLVHGGTGIDWGWVDRGMLGVRGGTLAMSFCEVFDSPECGLLAVGSQLQLADNHLHDLGDVGASIRPGCSGVVERNTIHGIFDDGLNIDGSNLQVIDNLVYDVGDDGIDFDGSVGLLARNIVHDAGQNAMTFAGDEEGVWLENNLLYGSGAGLEIKQSSRITVFNTTIADNYRGLRLFENAPGNGGGVGILRNVIVWGNTIPYSIDDESALYALFSDIQGDSVFTGNGNINADPLFVAPAEGIYKLQDFSPCIDAGLATLAPEGDYEGHARWDHPKVDNTGAPKGLDYYDIGFDEYIPGSSPVPEREWARSRPILGLPRPNPFHDRTLAVLDLPRAARIRLVVASVDGRLIRTLGSGSYTAGRSTWIWDGRNDAGRRVAPGRYLLVPHIDGRAGPARPLLLAR